MKQLALILLIISSLLAPMATTNATNYQEMFFKANELYKEGKYKQAQELYAQIPNKSPHVHYNLGNCAYKLGHPGHALAHWRRAEKNWGLFNRAELLHNIDMVKKQNKPKQADEDSPLDQLKQLVDGTTNTIISSVRATPLFLLQLLFLLMWVLSFLYLRYLYRRRQKAVIMFLFAANIFCGALLAIRYNYEYREHGVIVAKKTDLLSGPGKNYQNLGTLGETKQVLIKGLSDGYYKVKVNGVIGWVQKEAIETY